jgi:hypothetical protein
MAATGNFLADLIQLAGAWPSDLDPEAVVRAGQIPEECLGAVERIERRFAGSGPTFEFHGDLLQHFSERLGAEPDQWEGIEGYPFQKRGLLWYGTGLLREGRPVGPVIFLRDGWGVVLKDGGGPFHASGWDDWIDHRWSGADSALVFTGYDEMAQREAEVLKEAMDGLGASRIQMLSVKQTQWYEPIPWEHPVRLGPSEGDEWARRSLKLAYRVLQRMENAIRFSRKEPLSMDSGHLRALQTEEELRAWFEGSV